MTNHFNNTPDSELLFSKHHLFHLLWPLVVEQLLSVLVGMVDVLMVAYVGEATVSGVSLVDSDGSLRPVHRRRELQSRR